MRLPAAAAIPAAAAVAWAALLQAHKLEAEDLNYIKKELLRGKSYFGF